MHHVFVVFRRFFQLVRRERLHRVAFIVAAVILIGSSAITLFEDKLAFSDALWWSVVTMTTVGYGDISPVTTGGRIVGMGVMILGIGLLGLLTAIIASMFVENKIMENKGMKKPQVSNPFVICGWNFRAADIVEELRADPKCGNLPIVVIADLTEKPTMDPNVHFLRGEVRQDVLEMAGMSSAGVAIVLADDRLDAYARDAKTILNTLTIKNLYPAVYVCVELMDPNNVEHCRMARADEIIVVGELSSNLIVQAALDHGITRIITELVSNRFGNELYKIEPPSRWIGSTFIEVLTEMKQEHGILCVAIEKEEQGALIANPDADYRLDNGDRLIIIASERPRFG